MKIVIDTNVVVSGVFFRGPSSRVLEAVVDGVIEVSASPEIIDEYRRIVQFVAVKKGGKYAGQFRTDAFSGFLDMLEVVFPKRRFKVCRDPKDDMFIDCAVEAKALCIVSGDDDLKSLGTVEGIEVITAAEFCSRFLESGIDTPNI